MTEKFNNLPEYIREAIALMALQVLSTGQSRNIDPSGIRELFCELFGDVASANPRPRMARIRCISPEQAVIMLSMMEADDLCAFGEYIDEKAGKDTAKKKTAAEILKKVGVPKRSRTLSAGLAPEFDEVTELENEDGQSQKEPELAVITDITAVRSDPKEVLKIKVEEGGEEYEIRGCYESWKEAGLCPAKGEVGIICRKKDTLEGVLCYLIVLHDLVVPVLQDGLRRMDSLEFKRHRIYNRIMAYDKDNARLLQLDIKE